MGLAVCHQVVTAHKGKIEIAEMPETGARFVITLPAAKPDSLEGPGRAKPG